MDEALRRSALTGIQNYLLKHQSGFLEALKADLGKPPSEALIAEFDFIQHEIRCMLKNLRSWIAPKRLCSPLAFFPARAYLYAEPYGRVLILAPWNYPLQLSLVPTVGALAAGNQVVLKPSERAPATAGFLLQMANTLGSFEVVTGNASVAESLLQQRFDFIFYTGSSAVGKKVMEAASKHLTPVCLELGGKSPALLYSKNLKLAAKRIAWGKTLNAGQTCIAPDYVLLPKRSIPRFVVRYQYWVEQFFGSDPQQSKDYGRLIDTRHFERLIQMLRDSEILYGGVHDRDKHYLSPTLVSVEPDNPLLQEEVFGPILPLVACETLEEAIAFTQRYEKPLACYGFVDAKHDKQAILNGIPAGGTVFNDTLLQVAHPNLPFGGVGHSGMGRYHGKYSFETFSHQKSVLERSFWGENSLRYPPSSSFKQRLLRFFLR